MAVTQGDDLEVIQTETLGFLTLAGDAKVQLTSRWSDVPSPTAQLLSIASRKGLVAAAGPDAVYIASTDSVRKAFEAPKTGDSEVRPFEPQARLPLPFRISQLAFTADERYLLLSAESGGGLAVYDVQSLADGGTKAAFELNTNNEPLRCLVPNPSPELAKHCAMVTTNGNLYMANLDDRQLVSGANGPTLRPQVSCAAWSTKGKQLVAGMADGSVYQMTPDGTEKGHIPKPPSLGDCHVGSVSWLENNVFLVVHNANNQQDAAVYHIITRQPGETPSFTFQKLADPVEPFATDKVPHHTILRLKDFPPNLQDLLLVSSTATESIGLLTRSKAPLASDNQVTGVFTTTELADDSRRAQLPMSDSFEDTYPIGVALDFSSKNKVYKPIPTDEIEESPGPLPGLWVLNNEGVLASWWVVYNDSIRSGTTYPEITATDAPVPTAQFASTSTTTALPSALSGAFASSSSASQPSLPTAAPTFGSSSFGKPSAFGQPSLGLGAKTSLWGGGATSTAAAPAFGQSGFGSAPGTPGKLFGSGVAASPGTSGGFAGFAKPGNAGGFASFAKPETSGGFASFAKGSGGAFGSGGPASRGANVFGSKSGGAFASPAPEVSMDSDTAFPPPSAKKADSTPSFGSSPFVLGSTWKADPSASNDEKPTGGDKDKSLFGGGFGLSLKDAAEEPAAESKDEDMDAPTPAPVEKSQSPFGIADQGKTPSIFGKAEEKSSVFGTTPKPEEKASSVFGSAFKPQENTSSLFGGAPKPQDKTKSVFDEKESTTPTATPAPQKFDFKSVSASTGSNLFGTNPPASGGSGGLFGTGYIGSGTKSNIFGSPKVKTEEDDDEENLKDIPEAPLPPDTTSKATFPFAFGDSSSSDSSYSPYTALQTPTKATDAPLPPDFLSNTPAVKEEASTPADETPLPLKSTQKVASDMPLPPDFLAKPANEPSFKVPPAPSSSEEGEFSDEEDEVDEEDAGNGSEGSGVDVAKDLSPTSGFPSQTPGFTPQSSFGGMAGSAYSTISRSEVEGRPSLFGEIKNAPPLFPKPGPLSPRSPSPIRSAVRPSIFRDSARSVSAPGLASQFLGRRSQQPQPGSGLAASMRPLPVDPNVKAQQKLAAKREAEERMLFDPEDEGIQQILHSEVEPTLHMNEFLVVDQKLELDDHLGREDVPVHCEALWRDINRMIDKLGLNSRSLKSFILGHSQYHEDGRHKEDLENADDWILVEAKDLGEIIDDELAADLEDGRLKDIEQTEAAIHALARDLVKLRAKEEDIRRLMLSQTDPDQVAISKSIPLSAEQSAQQNELRRAFLNFSNLLAEAEEALTMLKTKLASAGGPSGKTPVPTVEAIIRTINKMTTMAEKRSGDIDVLENQMRRLRFSSVGLNGGSPARSREGSPFVGGASLLATPSKRASLMSPERMMRESTSSPGPYRGGTPRKKVSMFTEEEKKTIRAKADKRKAMLNLLATSLEKAGPNVSRLRDDD